MNDNLEELKAENRDLKLERSILEKAKNLFAEKRVEIILYSLIALIVSAVIIAWVTAIINKKPSL